MSNSLGTITPILVAQEALPVLADRFPFIGSFVTDFSSEPVLYNQTVYSRLPQVQAVQNYDTVNGYVASAGTLNDVPVTINNHRHTSVSFTDQQLTSTNLNLVEQFADSLAAAVGADIMSGVSALFTTGNYSNSVAVGSGNLVTRANSILAAKKSLDTAKVPVNERFIINSPQSEYELLQDESLVKLTWGAEGIGEDGLPTVHGFDFGTYTSLPGTNQLLAVAAQRASVVVAARAPEMPTESLNVPIPGKITNVVDPKTGFTIQVREFYNIQLGQLQVTYTWMYGCSVGSQASLVRIVRY
jgi:hypothetical protein